MALSVTKKGDSSLPLKTKLDEKYGKGVKTWRKTVLFVYVIKCTISKQKLEHSMSLHLKFVHQQRGNIVENLTYQSSEFITRFFCFAFRQALAKAGMIFS